MTGKKQSEDEHKNTVDDRRDTDTITNADVSMARKVRPTDDRRKKIGEELTTGKIRGRDHDPKLN